MPPTPLVVLVGAGASYDCTSNPPSETFDPLAASWRPPLVRGLFSDQFSKTLAEYPLVQMAASEINAAMRAADATGQSIAVEQFIRERYRDSSHESDRKKFASIPWYLQEIIYEAGKSYTRNPDHLGLLVSAALRLPEVVFVTLNYDTILDRRLTAFDQIASMGGYVAEHRPWSLIKPHGSVNWGREIDASEGWATSDIYRGSRVPRLTGETRYLDPESTLQELRLGPGWHFPALSVPLGAPDEIVCPDDHIEFLKRRLANCDGRIHLLVAGYSGLDDEVLRIFKELGVTAVTGRIVVNGEEEAFQVRSRLGNAMEVGPVAPAKERFGEFVQGDGLSRFLDEVAESPWSPLKP